ncbi:unnamed protein product [Enterobius vermicularis]|uniref:ShKT domain-containing protein n=1 Tax=Enterobius vermicularis TaxID=51028 RepID=A0A0N4UWB7_ENTVE|nr:unnamed protein product [Enterobius vermicularis]
MRGNSTYVQASNIFSHQFINCTWLIQNYLACIHSKHFCNHKCIHYSSASADCNDRTTNGVTDCPQKAHLCNSTLYYDYMSEQCPKTCNRCPPISEHFFTCLCFYNLNVDMRSDFAIGPISPCKDKVGANGTSNCVQNAALCFQEAYRSFMAVECPKTCGLC